MLFSNNIGGVMIRLLASCAVESGIELLSGMTKDYAIGICCLSAQHTNLRGRATTCWLGFWWMCSSGTTCLPTDCYVSELTLHESNSTCWSSKRRTSSSSHQIVACSRRDIAEISYREFPTHTNNNKY